VQGFDLSVILLTSRLKRRAPKTRRFFDALNTPIAVLVVLMVVVAVNSFLFFAYYLPRTTTEVPALPPERTEQRTHPLTTTTVERTRPTTTSFEGTTTSTATATATPSP
jgi:hypothetical protein